MMFLRISESWRWIRENHSSVENEYGLFTYHVDTYHFDSKSLRSTSPGENSQHQHAANHHSSNYVSADPGRRKGERARE